MGTDRISGADCITSLTPTLCRLMGIEPPTLSEQHVLQAVVETGQTEFSRTRLDRCFIYAPDAIGTSLYYEYSSYFKPVLRYAPLVVPLESVFPTKTPVCFASMFTGALPEVHGIKVYEKPVLNCDTIFDALSRAGKKVAIVAVENSSIDRIFRERPIDYFSEHYDDQVTYRVLTLLRANEHDFILAYHQEYDDSLHSTHPKSQLSLKAIRNHIRSFAHMAKSCRKHWKGHNSLILFAPDHGAHVDPTTGKGTHGLDIQDDMQVTHFFGFSKGVGK